MSYYLRNKSKVDKYLAKREKEAEKFRKKLEAEPEYQARINEFEELRNKNNGN